MRSARKTPPLSSTARRPPGGEAWRAKNAATWRVTATSRSYGRPKATRAPRARSGRASRGGGREEAVEHDALGLLARDLGGERAAEEASAVAEDGDARARRRVARRGGAPWRRGTRSRAGRSGRGRGSTRRRASRGPRRGARARGPCCRRRGAGGGPTATRSTVNGGSPSPRSRGSATDRWCRRPRRRPARAPRRSSRRAARAIPSRPARAIQS